MTTEVKIRINLYVKKNDYKDVDAVRKKLTDFIVANPEFVMLTFAPEEQEVIG